MCIIHSQLVLIHIYTYVDFFSYKSNHEFFILFYVNGQHDNKYRKPTHINEKVRV